MERPFDWGAPCVSVSLRVLLWRVAIISLNYSDPRSRREEINKFISSEYRPIPIVFFDGDFSQAAQQRPPKARGRGAELLKNVPLFLEQF